MKPIHLNPNLLSFQNDLIIKDINGKQCVFDPIRKKYIILQPEEIVRQLLLHYLIQIKKYPASRINIEKQLTVLNSKRRFDMIIYDKSAHPTLLIECKAPKLKLSQKVFDQISKYNLAIKADYLLVTNGMDTFCCKMDYNRQSYQFIQKIPEYFT